MNAEKAPRALIVDDDPLMRWALQESLAGAGFTSVAAGTRRQALAEIAAAPAPFDLVVLDYVLPDSSGFELLEKLHELSPAARIIMITSYGSPDFTRGALESGAAQVMTKPFEMDTFADAMKAAAA